MPDCKHEEVKYDLEGAIELAFGERTCDKCGAIICYTCTIQAEPFWWICIPCAEKEQQEEDKDWDKNCLQAIAESMDIAPK